MKVLLLAAAVLMSACASAPSPLTAPEAAKSRVSPIIIGESFQITSQTLGEERTYNVWLPPSYAKGAGNYPVLYLIDGGVAQDFHHISGLAQLGAIAAMFQEVIVVGVETKDRQRELTYPSDDAEHIQEFPTHGDSDKFRAHITGEIMPAIDARFRTSGSNGLIGESLAGLFITETFLRAPEKFDAFIAISPSLWWDNESLGKEAAARVAALPGKERKIYLAIANEGGMMRNAVLQLVSALKTKKAPGVAWMFSDRPDLEHSTIYHREALEALVFAYPLDKKNDD